MVYANFRIVGMKNGRDKVAAMTSFLNDLTDGNLRRTYFSPELALISPLPESGAVAIVYNKLPQSIIRRPDLEIRGLDEEQVKEGFREMNSALREYSVRLRRAA